VTRPRLLDLFCGAGGATRGYQLAGFHVTGVDIAAMPHYCGDEFRQADALGFSLDGYDAIHASPPCQHWTHAKHMGNRGRSDHPQLIAPIRERLRAWGGPYVIENVEDAKAFLLSPVTLCGSSLGLPDLERHRCFESNVGLMAPGCAHGLRGPARFPGTPRSDGSRPLSRIANAMASGISHEVLAAAMGIDWMPGSGFRPSRELHEAIPPAYTEFIGEQLLAFLWAEEAEAL
jgi:DNA (cytosine-5)-methyltransferase 1